MNDNANISRRDFVHIAAGIAITPALKRFAYAPVSIAFIYAPDYATAKKAAEMSAEEAQRAASLLKRELRFTALAESDVQRIDPDWTALILATSRRLSLPPQLTMVDIANRPACAPNTFYLRPATNHAVWHASLERFGAAQLNDRFRAAGIRIDDQAWLGWFAVKILWEAGVRGKTLDAMSFDGHKGRALTFDRARTIVQPLYELSADKSKVIAERSSPPNAKACP